MSRWSEFGYPDEIKNLMSPYKLMAGINLALTERYFGRHKPINQNQIINYSTIDLYYWAQDVDSNIFRNREDWLNPYCDTPYDYDSHGMMERTPESFLSADIIEGILGEPIIYAKKWRFEAHFIEWALQRYKIINLFYKYKKNGSAWSGASIYGYSYYREVYSTPDAARSRAIGDARHHEWGPSGGGEAGSFVRFGYDKYDKSYYFSFLSSALKLKLESIFNCGYGAKAVFCMDIPEDYPDGFKSENYTLGVNSVELGNYSGNAAINTEHAFGDYPVIYPAGEEGYFGSILRKLYVIYNYSVPGGFEFLDL